MKKSKIGAAVLILALSFLCIGCKRDMQEVAEEISANTNEVDNINFKSVAALNSKPGMIIAMIGRNQSSSYWRRVNEGAQQAIDDLNETKGYKGEDKVKLIFLQPDTEDLEKQINMMDELIVENPDVLCLASIDSRSFSAQVEQANENGIPVVAFDSDIQMDLPTICETDHYDAGILAAQKLCELIGEEGEIMIVAPDSQSENEKKRKRGFIDEVNKHPHITIVEQIAINESDTEIERTITQSLLDNPNLKGIFTANDMAGELLLSIREKNKIQDLIQVGFDSGRIQNQAIEKGTLSGVVTQKPFGLGYVTVVAAIRLAVGQEVGERIDTGFIWVDQTNIQSDEIQKILYE